MLIGGDVMVEWGKDAHYNGKRQKKDRQPNHRKSSFLTGHERC